MEAQSHRQIQWPSQAAKPDFTAAALRRALLLGLPRAADGGRAAEAHGGRAAVRWLGRSAEGGQREARRSGQGATSATLRRSATARPSAPLHSATAVYGGGCCSAAARGPRPGVAPCSPALASFSPFWPLRAFLAAPRAAWLARPRERHGRSGPSLAGCTKARLAWQRGNGVTVFLCPAAYFIYSANTTFSCYYTIMLLYYYTIILLYYYAIALCFYHAVVSLHSTFHRRTRRWSRQPSRCSRHLLHPALPGFVVIQQLVRFRPGLGYCACHGALVYAFF